MTINTIANIKQAVVDIIDVLPPEKRQELLSFAEFLHSKNTIRQPRRSIAGLCADLDINITEEDIREARQEMWGNFPKDIEL
jgi:hypothetical protein